MAKRGRPEGHKLSDKTKHKISESKTGQIHSFITRTKIANGVRTYFSSAAGLAQRNKLRTAYTGFWSSDAGQEIRQIISEGLHQHYSETE